MNAKTSQTNLPSLIWPRVTIATVRRWLLTLVRLTPVIGVACVMSVVGLLLFRALMPADVLIAASSELGNYLQTLGGIYAVLLAFVVYVVWGQFNEVRTYIDREASAIVDLHRTASNLPADTRTAIHTTSSRSPTRSIVASSPFAIAGHSSASTAST